MEKASPEVKKALINTVKTQIKENNPPETKQAFMRLLGEGIPEKDVYIYLAQAIAYETYYMMKEKRPFDNENYVKLLAKLPNLD